MTLSGRGKETEEAAQGVVSTVNGTSEGVGVRDRGLPLPGAVPTLQLIDALFDRLNSRGVVYCHWKSNHRLEKALVGEDDLDLLIDRQDAPVFLETLAQLGFKRVCERSRQSPPSVEQYYAVDPSTLRLFHVDAYYRIVTGESAIKDYHLPVEKLLLEERRYLGRVPVPDPAAELATFVVRLMLKLDSPTAILPQAQARLRLAGKAEIDWLMTQTTVDRARNLIQLHLPSLDAHLWESCLRAVVNGEPARGLRVLARRIKRQLSCYRRMGGLRSLLLYASIGAGALLHMAKGGGRTKGLASGGAVVAFVGPEATGKSTLAAAVARWLGVAVDTRRGHLGKPPPTLLTYLPNLTLPVLRRSVPQQRTDRLEEVTAKVSILFATRCLMIAWDRYSAAKRIHRQAANGSIVFCDRYPTTRVGAADSPRLRPGGICWRGRAAVLEGSLYRRIHPPDLVLRLTVAPEVAVSRNRQREKAGKESDERVLARHAQLRVMDYAARTVVLDTTGDLEKTVREAKDAVWRGL